MNAEMIEFEEETVVRDGIKSFRKIHNYISVWDLLSNERARSLTVMMSWDSQECLDLKPCCLSERMEWESKWFIIWE